MRWFLNWHGCFLLRWYDKVRYLLAEQCPFHSLELKELQNTVLYFAFSGLSNCAIYACINVYTYMHAHICVKSPKYYSSLTFIENYFENVSWSVVGFIRAERYIPISVQILFSPPLLLLSHQTKYVEKCKYPKAKNQFAEGSSMICKDKQRNLWGIMCTQGDSVTESREWKGWGRNELSTGADGCLKKWIKSKTPTWKIGGKDSPVGTVVFCQVNNAWIALS